MSVFKLYERYRKFGFVLCVNCLIVLALVLLALPWWIRCNFGRVSAEQILFFCFAELEGTDKSLLFSFILYVLVFPFLLSVILSGMAVICDKKHFYFGLLINRNCLPEIRFVQKIRQHINPFYVRAIIFL